MKYDERHGGPYDRGGADSYYRRPFRPHYFVGATYQSKEIAIPVGTDEYEAYKAGFVQLPVPKFHRSNEQRNKVSR